MYRFTKRLVQEKPLGAFGGLVILTMLIVGLLAHLIAPYEYDLPDFYNILSAPNGTYILGTDQLGRDMLSRIIVGARVSMIVVVGAVTMRVVIGRWMENSESFTSHPTVMIAAAYL